MDEEEKEILKLTLIYAENKDKFTEEEKKIILNTLKMIQRGK